MQKTDLELQEAVISAMAFAYVAWGVSADEVAAQDLIAELSVMGYKIVKDKPE